MTELQRFILQSKKCLLNIFYTAGYPEPGNTVTIARSLAAAGVELVEIGMPYSDPLADGATIQHSSEVALQKGMNLDLLFDQVGEITATTQLRVVLMGYLNQMMRVGEETFLQRCRTAGVQGLIIPDLPMEIYREQYRSAFNRYGIAISFLITPRTPPERIRAADELSSGFLYLVADNSITGQQRGKFSPEQREYFARIRDMNLKSPVLIGFGISTAGQYREACRYAQGVIIGSEFIRQLEKGEGPEVALDFVSMIRN